MGFKHGNNLHLGLEELTKWNDFLAKYGYKKLSQQFIGTYGIVSLPTDIGFLNMKAVAGSAVNLITVKSGIAVDKNVNHIIIPTDAVDAITTPIDSVPRYIKASYNTTSEEVGTISIATNGTITGTGTLFTTILRGQPYHATKIKFINSALNTQEYEVLSVTSDTVALIQGASFSAEASLRYKVVGTFTPGEVVNTGDKYPYQYDYYTLSLSNSSSVIAGVEFLIARVTSDGITTAIVDLRASNIFSIITSSSVPSAGLSILNPLIGVEFAKFGTSYDPKNKSLVRIGFGFRSNTTQWTPSPSTFEVTINAGFGGAYGTSADVNAGDFDGWRIYWSNNKNFRNIISTTIVSAGVVKLLLDDYSGSDPTSGDIVITPVADKIEIFAENTSTNSNSSKIYDMSLGYVEMYMSPGANVITWRHVLNEQYTVGGLINNGNYLTELSFDDSGNQITSTTASITSGTLICGVHPRNFKDIKANIDTPNTYTGGLQNFCMGSVIFPLYNSTLNQLGFLLRNDGNYFECPMQANNTTITDINFGTATMQNGGFMFIKFTGAFTGNKLLKKTTAGVSGFQWNSQSLLSDNLFIKGGDILMLMNKIDSFGANEWCVIAAYSQERFMIDSLKRRIFDPLYPQDNNTIF